MATIKGTIKAISISKQKGTKKFNVPCADLRVDFGVVGDAHATGHIITSKRTVTDADNKVAKAYETTSKSWHRQVSLLAVESIEKMKSKGAKVSPGDFAENITTEGIDLQRLKIGGRVRLGENVELEVTQFGKKCHDRCEIFKQVGDCIMPREGVFAKVIKAGSVSVGDSIEAVDD